jgi:hypothetical protein
MRQAFGLALGLLAAAVLGVLILTPRPAATPTAPNAAPSSPDPERAADPPEWRGRAPDAFLGIWAAREADCAPGRESRLVIADDRLTFHESSGPILARTSTASDDVTFQVELTGEGERRTVAHRFRLADAGQALVALDAAGSEILIRRRCVD